MSLQQGHDMNRKDIVSNLRMTMHISCAGSEMLSSSDVDSLGVEDFINSVYVYAVALSNLIRDTCPDGRVCDALFDVPSEDWIEHLRAVDFVSHVGLRKRVKFDENGDGPAHYSFYQLTEMNGVYQYGQVGGWTSDGGLDLNKDLLKFYGQDGSIVDMPESPCLEKFCGDPVCHYADDRIEFVIEALFDLHGGECGALQENRFTQVEAALFAVRQINRYSDLRMDARMSLTINDICGDTADAGRAALRLVQGWDFDGGFPGQDQQSYLLGMLHSGSSGKAIAESKVLQVADVPLIASSATSPALSDKSMFGNFLRTVPSDIKQAAAMVELLTRLGLTYIQTIYTMGAYGEGGIKALKEAAKEKGICIANSHFIDSDTNFANLLNNILAKPEARTLVLFLIDENAQALFGEMLTRNVDPSQFQIVASDTWGARTDYIPGLENQALGAFTVSPKTSVILEFEEYFLQQTPGTHNGINPFFIEYWTQKFKCNLPGGDTTYDKNCTGSEMLSRNDVNSLGMENIINVVYAYEFSLSNLIGELCPGGGICDALYNVTSQGWLDYLQEVAFISQFGSKKLVSFDENGDGTASYSIYQLQHMNNVYHLQEVGSWDDVIGVSNLTDVIIDPMFSSQCTGLCLECNPRSATNSTFDQDNYFRIPGDLDLPVVLQLSESGDGVTCGDPKPEESLVLESLLYALDKVNSDPSILPGINLGVTVVDSCGNPAVAIWKLVGLLGGFVNLEGTGKPFAVLGPAKSDVAEEIAEIITGLSKLPMVSHGAVSPSLSNNPRVLSTSAPYIEEVAAIIAILNAYNWAYVGVVHSASPYGKANNQEFQVAAWEAGICIGPQHFVNDTTDIQDIMNDFSSDESLNVIVAFVSERHARSLLFADKFELTRRFVWVGTHTWDSLTLVSGLENTAKGMLVVASDSQDLPEIQDYFSNSDSLRAASLRDPYLRDYLQEICPSLSDCQLENQLQESLKELSGEIVPLVNALYVAAHGVNLLHDIKCGSSSDELCKSFYDSSPDEKVDAIRRVTVESGAGGKPFLFNGGSVPAAYSIKNYQYDGQNGQFLVVGEWHNNQLSIRSAGVNLYSPDAEEPQRSPSGCSCGPLLSPEGAYSQQAHVWSWIDHGIWATVVLALSGLCGVFAVLIAILFLSNRQSYVVQSASFSLSAWLLFGIVLMYLLNLAFMFKPNTAICGIRRFGISFVYCMVYAAMFAKSIRANRFARKQPGVDMNFAGSWSQSLLFLAFLLPEIFLIVEWLVLIPPGVSLPSVNSDTCASSSVQTCAISNIDLTIFMMYAYFLVLVTFFSSFGALNSPHAQHEGKSISVSSLFSILILTAWACVLHLADPLYGIPGISIGLTADATIILVLMFLGKVGALTKKEEADGGNKKVRDADVEDRPEKVINVYENAGAVSDEAVQDQTPL
ncbi:metabotropic glutamate receptor 8-like [Acanthaster planci]|uniref:Metabotropic glutamate receptor 8-like n=1 Tax=Acanthaster planci TaxID=133434 RepID=A0A8B7ZFS1_ACAPL|nr:metabotropic glutamate receptor 8-like [Acanthaster planci]